MTAPHCFMYGKLNSVHQDTCLQPLLFSWRWHYSSGLWLIHGPLSACASYLTKLDLVTALGSMHGILATEWGYMWVSHVRHWRCPQANWRDLWALFQQLVGKLPDGVHRVVIRDHVPLIPSENLFCCSPEFLPHPSHGASNLVLWMLQERNEYLWH